MNLNEILIEYGKAENIGHLAVDQSGLCSVLVNETHVVTFESSFTEEGFYIYSAIAEVPHGQEETIFLMALKGNLFGKETGHSNIGYVEESRTLVLFEYFDQRALDYDLFHKRFQAFIQHLFYWAEKLKPENLVHYLHK